MRGGVRARGVPGVGAVRGAILAGVLGSVVLGCATNGPGGSHDPSDSRADADVAAVATDGQPIPIEDARVSDKVTIVDFRADWCAPCGELDAHLRHLAHEYPDVAVRSIDVEDWDGPIARTMLVGVPELPHVVVFDARGRRVAQITGLKLRALDRAVMRALARAEDED